MKQCKTTRTLRTEPLFPHLHKFNSKCAMSVRQSGKAMASIRVSKTLHISVGWSVTFTSKRILRDLARSCYSSTLPRLLQCLRNMATTLPSWMVRSSLFFLSLLCLALSLSLVLAQYLSLSSPSGTFRFAENRLVLHILAVVHPGSGQLLPCVFSIADTRTEELYREMLECGRDSFLRRN